MSTGFLKASTLIINLKQPHPIMFILREADPVLHYNNIVRVNGENRNAY